MALLDFVDLNKIAAGVFWWHQQIISPTILLALPIWYAPFRWRYRHVRPGLTIFEPVTLFRLPEGGSPSKKFAPRNILGLWNPHRARRRVAVPF